MALKSVSKAVISLFDLIEAEGRLMRNMTVAVAENLFIALFGMLFMAAGFSLAIVAVYIWLMRTYSVITATVVTALLLFGAGVAMFLYGHSGAARGGRKERHSEPKKETAKDAILPAEGGGKTVETERTADGI